MDEILGTRTIVRGISLSDRLQFYFGAAAVVAGIYMLIVGVHRYLRSIRDVHHAAPAKAGQPTLANLRRVHRLMLRERPVAAHDRAIAQQVLDRML
jgi:hypothetical protein